ncbi:HNH endonuclease family protein [Streptomyces sp. NPDC020403]|uniref:HNH endonuclease family protein n=1 Tax=Streptomyces sp. NPDC020403 TaxID=3154487 RepID=UPI0033C3CAD6
MDETVTGADINDPLNLVAADSSTNRRKGDGDTATWLPPNKGYRCAYVAGQVAVKRKYGLWVTAAERDAMTEVLSGCPRQKLPTGGNPTDSPAR